MDSPRQSFGFLPADGMAWASRGQMWTPEAPRRGGNRRTLLSRRPGNRSAHGEAVRSRSGQSWTLLPNHIFLKLVGLSGVSDVERLRHK